MSVQPIISRHLTANLYPPQNFFNPSGEVSPMPLIKIQCPETGALISTGISAPVDFFAHNKASGNETMCPHCDRSHAWDPVMAVSGHAAHLDI